MVLGMATVKVTVTLPEEQLQAIRELVAGGDADSVSGFVQHAVALALDDVAAWRSLLAETLAENGGDITADERAWADRVLSAGARGQRPSAA